MDKHTFACFFVLVMGTMVSGEGSGDELDLMYSAHDAEDHYDNDNHFPGNYNLNDTNNYNTHDPDNKKADEYDVYITSSKNPPVFSIFGEYIDGGWVAKTDTNNLPVGVHVTSTDCYTTVNMEFCNLTIRGLVKDGCKKINIFGKRNNYYVDIPILITGVLTLEMKVEENKCGMMEQRVDIIVVSKNIIKEEIETMEIDIPKLVENKRKETYIKIGVTIAVSVLINGIILGAIIMCMKKRNAAKGPTSV